MFTWFPIGPEDTTARLPAAVDTVDDGVLQNVRESIILKANKCIEEGGGLFQLLF
jgi:hypothetical protein